MSLQAVVLEPEGLLFDTDAIRADALHAALAAEGVHVAREAVRRVHAGSTLAMALAMLPEAARLDATGRDLVARRAADAVRDAFSSMPPRFEPGVADALAALAATHPLAVVSRATRTDAMHLLELAQVAVYVRTVRSLDAIDVETDVAPWRSAVERCGAMSGIALVPPPLRAAARAAGLEVRDGAVSDELFRLVHVAPGAREPHA